MWVRDDLFNDGVSLLWVGVGDSVLQCMTRQALCFRMEMAFLFVKKTLSIGNKELEVTDLRTIYGGIINFSKDAVPQGKPNPTGCRVGCPYPFFAPMGPAGINTRPPEGFSVAANLCHGPLYFC